jgi:chemotaxis protein MotB
MKLVSVLCAVAAMGPAACVSQVKYDRAVADATSAQDSLQYSIEQSIARAQADQQQVASLRHELDESKQESDRLEQEISKLKLAAHNSASTLDEQTALNQELRGQLGRLGKNVDQLLADKDALDKSLADTRQRLEDLRRAETAAVAQATVLRDVALKLKPLTDTAEVRVELRDGQVMVGLPSDGLFDAGRAELGAGGKSALRKVAKALRSLGDRQFQVAGHTDSVPLHNARFASNWELSAARAMAVLQFFVEEGIAPQMLSAAGYGQFSPVAPNEAAVDRAKNRRIEIKVVPRTGEIPAIPSWKS